MMRQFRHWEPRYIYHRTVRFYYEKSITSCPCLAIGAVKFLAGWLSDKDVCLEYGAGKSTLWFARLVGHLVSIESDRYWYETVRRLISEHRNAEIFLFEDKEDCVPGTCVCWNYVNKMDEFTSETFNLILNDGFARLHVGLKALALLKPGGILVWDDWANVFTMRTHIPKALPANSVVKDELLLEFWERVKNWRRAWYDDGTHSTAILFKPL